MEIIYDLTQDLNTTHRFYPTRKLVRAGRR